MKTSTIRFIVTAFFASIFLGMLAYQFIHNHQELINKLIEA